MIGRFVRAFEEARPELAEKWGSEPPNSYEEIVSGAIRAVRSKLVEGGREDPAETVHSIDDGDYQGTLLFLIPADLYQPSVYWYAFVGYGSCSGCDTLSWVKDLPEAERMPHYLALAYDVVRGLKRISAWGRWDDPAERHQTALEEIAKADPDTDDPASVLAWAVRKAALAIEEEVSPS